MVFQEDTFQNDAFQIQDGQFYSSVAVIPDPAEGLGRTMNPIAVGGLPNQSSVDTDSNLIKVGNYGFGF